MCPFGWPLMKILLEISDGAALSLSCNLPTLVIANHFIDIQGGETEAVIGCGQIG